MPKRPHAGSSRWHGLLVSLVALWGMQTIITFAHLGGDFGYTDAATHTLDGVFFSDFYRDLPLGDLKTYVLGWYARAPRLGLGYYPPLVAMIEGAAFSVFGVSIPVARAVVFGFALVGVTFLFLGVTRLWGTWVGFVSTVFYLAAPGVAKLSREVMLEVPAMALMCVAFYGLARYLTHPTEEHPGAADPETPSRPVEDAARRRPGADMPVCALVFTILAAYAKQPAGLFITAVLVAVFVKHGRRGWKPALATAGVFVVAVSPLLVMLIWLGRATWSNLAGAARGIERLAGFGNWCYYPLAFVTWQSTVPVGILACLGLALALVRPDRRRWLVVLAWAAAFYAVMSLVGHKSPRVGVFWVVPLSVLAGGGLDIAKVGTRIGALLAVAAVATCAWQIASGLDEHYARVDGFERVAQFVAGHCQIDSVFYQGYHNGSFIYRLRERLGRRGPVVLRASRVVHTTAIMPEFGGRQRVFSESELLDVFRRFGTKLVVLESHNFEEKGLEGFKIARGLVKGAKFRELARFPIRTEDPRFGGLDVTVYEFVEDVKRQAQTMDLDFTSIGKSFEVDLVAW